MSSLVLSPQQRSLYQCTLVIWKDCKCSFFIRHMNNICYDYTFIYVSRTYIFFFLNWIRFVSSTLSLLKFKIKVKSIQRHFCNASYVKYSYRYREPTILKYEITLIFVCILLELDDTWATLTALQSRVLFRDVLALVDKSIKWNIFLINIYCHVYQRM